MASEHYLFEIAAAQIDGSSPVPHPHSFGISASYDDDSSWSPCIQGYNWRCTYSTNTCAGTVSFTVCLPYNSTGEPVNASFKLSLLDGGGRPVPSRTRAASFQNCLIPQMWQWECPGFITRDDLQRRQQYLNKDGRFTVRCDIAVVKPTFITAGKADDVVSGTAAVPPSDLYQHLGDLLARKDGADVTFRLVPGGETFSAHRCVLAARSPVFRAQLFGQMKESQQSAAGGGGAAVVIPIEDIEARVFSSLLAFIYTDSLPPPETAAVTGHGAEQNGDDDDEATVQYQQLFAAADRYGLERMKLVCQEKLCEHIHADSVAAMLVLADRHHCPGLKEACFRFLTSSANLDSFTAETDGFEVLNASCPAVLKELLAKLATVLIF